MAIGLPVIATRVGGLPEAVVDGETGLLVPPADPAALGAAIGRLRADPGLRKRMGENGRRRAQQHFSLDAYLRKMEGVYEMALGRAREPSTAPVGGGEMARRRLP
jgi:glycosyltransferase involved in cell wall biosynthesis